MEFIVISESKLKVMLTDADLRRYEITCEELDGTGLAARRAFWSILDEAKKQTGFDTGKNKLFVQMYPGKNGGCELFVTRLGIKKETKSANISRDGTAAEYLPTGDALSSSAEQCLYAFETLSDLLLACKRLSTQKDPPLAYAYANDERSRFYLSLGADCTALSEYNGERCRPRDFMYISEHCRLFCTDAVTRLAEFS